MHDTAPTQTLPIMPAVLRGLTLRCPQCGEGKLFKSYLKQVDSCAKCGERYAAFRADDGPAWLTILLTGHIVVPLLVYLVRNDVMSYGAEIILTFALTTGLVLGFLPPAKGTFIAALWLIAQRHKAQGNA